MQQQCQSAELQRKLELLFSTEETKQALEDCLAEFHAEEGRFPNEQEMEVIATELILQAAINIDPTLGMSETELSVYKTHEFIRKHRKWFIIGFFIIMMILAGLHETFINSHVDHLNSLGRPIYLFP